MYTCPIHGKVIGQQAHYQCPDCGWQLKTCQVCADTMSDKDFNNRFMFNLPFPTAIQCNACGSTNPLTVIIDPPDPPPVP